MRLIHRALPMPDRWPSPRLCQAALRQRFAIGSANIAPCFADDRHALVMRTPLVREALEMTAQRDCRNDLTNNALQQHHRSREISELPPPTSV